MPKKIQYLTLSHCWGKHQLVRLLKSNVASFSQDVPYDLLPPTFRDAVRITRRLGFEYLWIDSLCIIQDSAEDWNHEARLMGKIYMNATCNIAASDAPDSSHGCLYPRNPRIIQPDAINSHNGTEQFIFNRTDVYEEDHTLYTRAWVSTPYKFPVSSIQILTPSTHLGPSRSHPRPPHPRLRPRPTLLALRLPTLQRSLPLWRPDKHLPRRPSRVGV
jgi:hypothetical protein